MNVDTTVPGQDPAAHSEALEQEHLRELEALASEALAAGDRAEPAGGESELATARGEAPERDGAEAAPLKRVTPFDEQRARIADRFRQRRAAAGGALDFHGDHRDATQSYGQVAAPAGPAPAPLSDVAHWREPGVPGYATAGSEDGLNGAAAPGSADRASSGARAGCEESESSEQGVDPSSGSPSSKLYRGKVNGVDVLLTEPQLLAEAQKSLASGDLLGQAKHAYRGAKRDGSTQPVAPNQGEPDSAPNSARTRSEAPPPSQRPALDEVIRELQYAPPEEIAPRLRQAVSAEAQEAAREAVLRERVERELVGARRALAQFEQANAELARDQFARDAIEHQVYREYGDDLMALGIPAEHIPQDPLTRASWHNQLRATGGPVRDIASILTSARDKFVAWKGAPKPQQRPQGQSPPAHSASPRVEVSVNRDERRAAIPIQPTRATVPPQAPAPPPEPRSRSEVIAAMRKGRGQIVA